MRLQVQVPATSIASKMNLCTNTCVEARKQVSDYFFNKKATLGVLKHTFCISALSRSIKETQAVRAACEMLRTVATKGIEMP